MTPQNPNVCPRTGRLLTEWFEYPEKTDEDVIKEACEEAGTTVEDRPMIRAGDTLHPDFELAQKVNSLIAGRKKRAWKNGMSQQEVAQRMDQATKMVNPDNYKFLDDGIRERTGLEVNPLWMIECLVRSGVLSPKEQVAALKELAGYTHSKAPSISHSTTTQMNPEDWLLELAKDEYTEIDFKQPMQPVERGMGKTYESNILKRTKETDALAVHADEDLKMMMLEVDAEWEEEDDDD